jgi:hypothetical protein
MLNNYRVYFVDAQRQLALPPEEIYADGDLKAAAIALARCSIDAEAEVWHGLRLVCRLSKNPGVVL